MFTVIGEKTHEPSRVQKYYVGSSVFITGATGFLGKLLLEKLLRTCSDVQKVFILIREKKGNSIEKRFEELLNNTCFKRVKREQPNFSEKIVLLSGDCSLPGLGLSESSKQQLIDEVNCIFHCAATVRFDEKLRNAVHINIRATRDLLILSKTIKNLQAFIYVSTAYSYCNRKEIKEEFYEPTITGEKLLAVVDIMSDQLLENIAPKLLENWPNTYVLTKAIAEEVVRTEGVFLPVAVIRPSIVIATAEEPVPGWIDNFYGTTGVSIGVALGVIRTLHCKVDNKADVVPADFVVNCAIAAAWEVGTTSQYCSNRTLNGVLDANDINDSFSADVNFPDTNSNGLLTATKPIEEVKRVREVKIYNYVSSPQTSITWRVFMDYAEKHLRSMPSPLMVWNYFIIVNRYYFMHVICVFLLHTIPAHIADLIARCMGKEPMFVKGYRKINKHLDVTSYFSTNEWIFENSNTQALWGKLNSEDRRLFNFDLRGVDWDLYAKMYALGGRIYLLKDSLDTLPQGRIKYIKLKVAHYTLVGILLLVFYKLLLMLWNLVF